MKSTSGGQVITWCTKPNLKNSDIIPIIRHVALQGWVTYSDEKTLKIFEKVCHCRSYEIHPRRPSHHLGHHRQRKSSVTFQNIPHLVIQKTFSSTGFYEKREIFPNIRNVALQKTFFVIVVAMKMRTSSFRKPSRVLPAKKKPS